MNFYHWLIQNKNLSKATSEFTNALETMYKEVNNMQTSNQIPNDPEFHDTFAESFYQAVQKRHVKGFPEHARQTLVFF